MSESAKDKTGKAEKKPPRQVFQGKFMRENASFLDTLFYRYAWPLLESAQIERVCIEQYGDLPDRLRVEHEEKLISEHVQYFIKKNP